MSFDSEKLRVLIPTTSGLVEVLLLTDEDAAMGRCVACIGGTTETADITAAYHAFVVRPTGAIERLFGHPCYRLDVSGPIDAGSSWQVGVLAAHALHAVGRLAQENDPADGVVWATGSVRPVDLTVGGVSHVPEKLAHSMQRLKQEAAAGRRVVLAIPDQNAESVSASVRSELVGLGAELIEFSHTRALFDALAVKLPEAVRRVGKIPAAPSHAGGATPSRWRYAWAAAAVALVCVASAGIFLMARPPATVTKVEQPPETSLPQKEVRTLVPELVPLIRERDRDSIRDLYMSAPEYKALAVGPSRMAFVTAQPDQSTADAAAVETCKQLENARRLRAGQQADRTCDLYASGTVVVGSRAYPPMPPAPWIIRDPSIERPFVAAELPLVSAGTKERAERSYGALHKSKAFAVAPTGLFHVYSGMPTAEEASRRALELCGYDAGIACMVIAVDDTFVVPIPTLAKVVGFYRPEALTAAAPELRDYVARRLKNATSGWNTIAVGASGRIGIKLSAESEQAAIDGAMQACSAQDRNCHVAVIGPFLVQAEP
jgi:hypothetical protein